MEIQLQADIPESPQNVPTSQCSKCYEIMPHIAHRKCKCHHLKCTRYKPEVKGTCTIFRKLSKTELKQDELPHENEIHWR